MFRSGFFALLKKELLQLLRNKQLFFLLVMTPIVQLLMYGYALSPDVKHLRLGVVDYAISNNSRELLSALTENGVFDLVESGENEKTLFEDLRDGKLDAGIVVPPDLERTLKQNKICQVQVVLDGVDANTAGIAASYIVQIFSNFKTRYDTNFGNFDLIQTESNFLYNPGLVSSWFFVPGVIGMVLNIAGILVSSATLLREKETGTLEQLLMTPVSSAEILIAKIIPLVIVLFINIAVSLVIGMSVFALPFKGSPWTLFVISLLYVFVVMSIGIALATISSNQRQAMLISFFITMPIIQLSGALSPLESMPDFFRELSALNPLRYYIVCLKAILLKGIGLDVLWPQVLILFCFAFFLLTLSASRFRKQLACFIICFLSTCVYSNMYSKVYAAETENQFFSPTISTQFISPSSVILKSLISVNKNLDPFQLDANSVRNITLKEILDIAVSSSLDIKISRTKEKSKQWGLYSSYAQFMPSLTTSYRWQYLLGKPNIPLSGGADPIRLNTPFIIAGAGFNQYLYRGGKTLNTALQSHNNLNAAKFLAKATLSDILNDSTKRYYELLLANAILQIRIKAVQTSEAQLELNRNLLAGGKATKLDVLQAQSQLATDRQNLIEQQIERRNAAINLACILNLDQNVDLCPNSQKLELKRLFDEEMKPEAVLKASLDNRPELKQYREIWLAAKRNAKIASANLQPSLQVFGNIYGIGETLSNSSKSVSALSSASIAAAGGTSLNRRVSRRIAPLYTIGYQLNWDLKGLGAVDFTKTKESITEARASLLELNQQINRVTGEVRQSYLKSLGAFKKIDEAKVKVESSEEELRLAQMRFKYGVGRNIDILKAQEDNTSALIEYIRAFINFNIAQAQLMRDSGLISTENLLLDKPLALK